MQELIKLVAAKTGMSEENAKSAVDTVLGFLKEKLPAHIAAQIDRVVSGGGGGVAQAGNLLDSILGGKE